MTDTQLTPHLGTSSILRGRFINQSPLYIWQGESRECSHLWVFLVWGPFTPAKVRKSNVLKSGIYFHHASNVECNQCPCAPMPLQCHCKQPEVRRHWCSTHSSWWCNHWGMRWHGRHQVGGLPTALNEMWWSRWHWAHEVCMHMRVQVCLCLHVQK